MRRLPIVAVALLLAVATDLSARAQAPTAFDGAWQVQGARSADPFCSQLSWRTLSVSNGAVKGIVGHTRGAFNLTGQVAPDGSATFFGDGPFGMLARATGRFTGNSGAGSVRFTGPDTYCEIGWTAAR
jgi:hypothetical protein